MGSSQSRSNGQLKRYSRVASDQLKSVLRRHRSTQEKTADNEKPHNANAEQEVIRGGDHETETETETEQKTVNVSVYYVWLCPYSLDQQLQHTPMPVTVPCQVILIIPFDSIQAHELQV
jgi:hypothetical protein